MTNIKYRPLSNLVGTADREKYTSLLENTFVPQDLSSKECLYNICEKEEDEFGNIDYIPVDTALFFNFRTMKIEII